MLTGLLYAMKGEIESLLPEGAAPEKTVAGVPFYRIRENVVACCGGVGTIGEFWLEEDAQKRGLGEKLVGQALSYARSRGCSILSTGRIAKSNTAGLHCAEKWGFRPIREDAESVTFEKNFEYDEESCWKRLQEVIEQ